MEGNSEAAAARLNLDSFERVAVGHCKLELLAVVARGLHSSNLERAVAGLDSDSFEEVVAKLDMGGFEWTAAGLCKLGTWGAVTATKARGRDMRALAVLDGCEMTSVGLHLARTRMGAQAWVQLWRYLESDRRILALACLVRWSE